MFQSMFNKKKIIPYHENSHPLDTAIKQSIYNNHPGDYLEFGVNKGNSFIRSYHTFDHYIKYYNKKFSSNLKMPDFYAFDVFEGSVPESQIHKESEYIPSHWNNSLWSYSSEAFIKNCKSNNLDLNKIKVVKGLFEDTLTSFDQNIETASVIFFDSDFYNSTLQALKFSKKFMSIGTILVFDDYFRFRGKENYGPHGAFKNFCEEENIKFREFDLYKGQIVSYICSDIK